MYYKKHNRVLLWGARELLVLMSVSQLNHLMHIRSANNSGWGSLEQGDVCAAWEGTHSSSFSWGVTQPILTRAESRKRALLARVPVQRMAQ